MSANSSTPSPTSGSRLHDEDDDNDLTEGLDLGFDGAEDLLRVWRQGRRLHPMVQARVSFQAGAREHYGQQHQLASAELV